jgi:hypothetical protein
VKYELEGQMAATKATLEGLQRQGSSMHKVRTTVTVYSMVVTCTAVWRACSPHTCLLADMSPASPVRRANNNSAGAGAHEAAGQDLV